MSHVTGHQGQKVKGQLVADVLNSQHAEIGAAWRINKYEDIVSLQWAEAYRGGRRYSLLLVKNEDIL